MRYDLTLNGDRLLQAVHSSLNKRTPDPMVSDVLTRLSQSGRHKATLFGQQSDDERSLDERAIDAIADAMIQALPPRVSTTRPNLTEALSAALAGNDTSATEPATRSVADTVRRALSRSE